MRRVVVTGLGMVTPLASGVEQTWARLLAGESGIRRIEQFDVSDLPAKIGGMVPRGDAIGEFRPTDYVEAKELRRNDDFIVYGIAAAVQAVVTVTVATTVYDLDVAGPLWAVVLIAVVDGVLGVALGLLASAFARTEFQAVQFMPVFVLPQFFLCGLLVPIDQMDGWLQAIARVLPLTYAVDALKEVGAHPDPTGTMWLDIGIVAGAAVVALALAAATLRRRTP